MAGEDLSTGEQTVQEVCAGLLEEMSALRAFESPPAAADPPVVHAALLDLRDRLNRAEVIVAEMKSYKARARRTAAAKNAAFEDAFDAEMDALAKRAMRLEYQGVRDRIAMARVKATQERRAALAADRVASLVDQACDAAQGMFFGLRDIRAELLATLQHYLPWLSSMET